MEDDPGLSRLLQKSLQRRGYIVDVASNGEEGLALLGGTAYDLLLLDYNMPFCGGMDVIKTLSLKGTLPPTIMVTGDGNEEVAVEAMKLGAADYIVKDTEMKYLELLPVVIEQVLYRQQLLQERREMLEDVRESEERYRRLVELLPDGIVLYTENKIVYVNPAGTRLLGELKPGGIVGRPILDVIHPQNREEVQEGLRRLDRGDACLAWKEVRLEGVDGRELDAEISAFPLTLKGKRAVQLIFRDVTDRKIAAQKLERMALLDSLTGLPNRALFFDRFQQALASARRNKTIFALFYLDLDGFKRVNDTLGHDAGDRLLKETAQRLRSCLRQSDTVARIGGDEFTVILTKIERASDTAIVADKVMGVLDKPFPLGDRSRSISASIGISVYPDDGEDADMLLKKADMAMYRVKQSGKSGYQLAASEQV
jgi:diguanylate cyclase (GGDEF)-like protein/PAS domain S-box-containing protein